MGAFVDSLTRRDFVLLIASLVCIVLWSLVVVWLSNGENGYDPVYQDRNGTTTKVSKDLTVAGKIMITAATLGGLGTIIVTVLAFNKIYPKWEATHE